jgi:simple sugar transport system permease protein
MNDVVNLIYFIVQQTMFFTIPLMVVALGGMYSERSGVINIALEGIMVIGGFASILFINLMENTMSGQLLLLLAILIAMAAGAVFSLLHAYASINMKADQTISGTALNLLAPALAIFLARMIQPSSVQQINFNNTFRIDKVPVLGDIPVIGDLFFQKTYITTSIGVAVTKAISLLSTLWCLPS